jgi:transcriptional regulator with XRE-family HTH domain
VERARARGEPQQRALGAAVRELRARRGMSQENLGFAGGLHRNYVGAIERGEINPTLRILLKVCDGLAIPLSELTTVYERQMHDRLRGADSR